MNKFYFCDKCSEIVEKQPDKVCVMCRSRLAIWLSKQPRKERQEWLNNLKKQLGDNVGKKKKK